MKCAHEKRDGKYVICSFKFVRVRENFLFRSLNSLSPVLIAVKSTGYRDANKKVWFVESGNGLIESQDSLIIRDLFPFTVKVVLIRLLKLRAYVNELTCAILLRAIAWLLFPRIAFYIKLIRWKKSYLVDRR